MSFSRAVDCVDTDCALSGNDQLQHFPELGRILLLLFFNWTEFPRSGSNVPLHCFHKNGRKIVTFCQKPKTD